MRLWRLFEAPRGNKGEDRDIDRALHRAIAGIDRQRRWRNFDAFDLALNRAQ